MRPWGGKSKAEGPTGGTGESLRGAGVARLAIGGRRATWLREARNRPRKRYGPIFSQPRGETAVPLQKRRLIPKMANLVPRWPIWPSWKSFRVTAYDLASSDMAFLRTRPRWPRRPTVPGHLGNHL